MGAGAEGWSVLETQFDQTDVLETFACLTSWKHTNVVSQHENVAFDVRFSNKWMGQKVTSCQCVFPSAHCHDVSSYAPTQL